MDYQTFIKDLSKLIAFKTVQGEALPNAPFGIENKRALNFFLSLANEFGFSTINYDNYGGEIYFGEGEELGIIGHLDVVPAGNGWETDPFTLTEVDDFLYARGTEDDKTPCLLCLYALKELKEEGVKFNKKVRLLVGCNEESGWKDVEYMKEKTTFPKYGFSPDSNFPVSYAEKGLTHLKVALPKFKKFSSLCGGTVINAVCDYAKVTVDKDAIDLDLIKKYGLTLKDDCILESVGIGAHGSAPEKGKNALYPLLKYMEESGEDLYGLPDLLFKDGIGLSKFQNEQGKTTISPNLIITEGEKQYLACDVRIPAPVTLNDLKGNFALIKQEYTLTERHEPFMAKKDGWLVCGLLSAYNEVTGENAEPQYQSGSTFARVFEVGCGFGFGSTKGTRGCHEPNEGVSIEHLKKSFEIYKKAIYNLVK